MACCVSSPGEEERGANEVRAADRGEAQRAGASIAREPSPSTGSLVTPHAGITGGEQWRFLACGIDTLDLAGYVGWGSEWPELLKKLADGRARAQFVDKPVVFQDSCCGPLLVYPAGKRPMYLYHLEGKHFHLFLGANSDGLKASNLYVSFNSRAIWQIGAASCVESLQGLVREFGGSFHALKPSRVDLCADFLIPGGLPLSLLRDLGVPEDVMTNDFMQGATLETYYIGSKTSSIRARVYDKVKEIRKSLKIWFKDIWHVEKLEDIWRVEFQLRRESLKSYGLDSVPDLLAALGGMWRDLTTNWYSLRLRDDSNTSRRSVHPSWLAVQECADKFGPLVDVKRELAPGGNATADFYSSRAATLLAGYAACVGLPDITEALDSFMSAIAGRWDVDCFFEAYTAKVVKLAVDPVEPGEQGGDDEDIPF